MTRKIVMAAVKAVIELLAHNASYSQIRRELGVSKGFILSSRPLVMSTACSRREPCAP